MMRKVAILVVGLVFIGLVGPAGARSLSCTQARAAITGNCERHSPTIALAEQVQLAQPGETVSNTFVIRNADSCTCPSACFQLTSGYHPPGGYPNPENSLRVTRTRLRTPEDLAMNGACLAPGEEAQGVPHITLSAEQDSRGYVTPVIFAYRPSEPCYAEHEPGQIAWAAGCFEREGGALCAGMDYFECRTFVYPVGASR